MPRRAPSLAGAAAVALALLAGCGGDDADVAGPEMPPPAARAQDFPKPEPGETLGELGSGLPEGPILVPAVSVLRKGTNRVGFAVVDAARTQLTGAQVALYTSRPDGTAVRGPFLARSESLAVKAGFASKTTTQDPDAAKTVYVANARFTREGPVAVTAVVRLDGRLLRTGSESMRVGTKGKGPPDVGERAVAIDTETVASAGGDIAKIDTRVPPAPELHQENFRDVLGKKPAVLMFATPQLCQSRVCGPVVDVGLQVKAAVGDQVAFIHQEVFKDNSVEKGARPQLGAWHLATEPWTFVVDRKGIVRARFEGPMSVGELERAVSAVAG